LSEENNCSGSDIKLMEIKSVFGERVRELRKSSGLSQEELAFKSGLHRTYISSVELGERNISLVNMKKIADALEINIRQLFPDKD
jgi:transcriptional regulator with XRE-family HTH domain